MSFGPKLHSGGGCRVLLPSVLFVHQGFRQRAPSSGANNGTVWQHSGCKPPCHDTPRKVGLSPLRERGANPASAAHSRLDEEADGNCMVRGPEELGSGVARSNDNTEEHPNQNAVVFGSSGQYSEPYLGRSGQSRFSRLGDAAGRGSVGLARLSDGILHLEGDDVPGTNHARLD
jgi:hypothetical protein